MNECGNMYVLHCKTEASASCYLAKGVNTSCHKFVPQICSQLLPAVMLRCVLILTRAQRHMVSQRTKPSTSHCVWGLVGTSGSVVPLLLLPPDICLPLYLSLASPLDANTNQHFMCPGAVKWPPWGNLTRHELSRLTSCLLQPPDT